VLLWWSRERGEVRWRGAVPPACLRLLSIRSLLTPRQVHSVLRRHTHIHTVEAVIYRIIT
jgi:hypothetical protein